MTAGIVFVSPNPAAGFVSQATWPLGTVAPNSALPSATPTLVSEESH